MRKFMIDITLFAAMVFLNASASAQTSSSQRLQLDHGGETIVLEPYATNILRVTLSLNPNPALTAPGYGFAALCAKQPQLIAHIRVYPDVNATFTLFADDGQTYDYEKGGGRITHLRWDDAAQKLTHTRADAWSDQDSSVIEIVGR